jgi:hypothetical protein
MVLPLGVMLAVAGCGSGGAAKAEGGVVSCQPSYSGGGTMGWRDDGTPVCALSASASVSTDGTFVVDGMTTTGGISIGIGFPSGVAGMSGAYSCGSHDGGPGTSIVDSVGAGPGYIFVAQSCTVSLDMTVTVGARETGTFSATATATGGGTKSITDGVFDVPVAMGL